jgi:hypothetical protein
MEATTEGQSLDDRIGNTAPSVARSSGNGPSSLLSDDSLYGHRIWIDGRLKRRQCPKCGSRETQRSRRQGTFESVLMTLLLLRPFRCRNCDWRFFGLYFDFQAIRSPIPVSRARRVRLGQKP